MSEHAQGIAACHCRRRYALRRIRVTYDIATGNLYYDANGRGAGGLTQFAKLGIGLALTNADFAVV